MAIHTFSSKGSRPQDTQLIQDVKYLCQKHNLNFSGLVINLLRQWKEQDERRKEVQSTS